MGTLAKLEEKIKRNWKGHITREHKNDKRMCQLCEDFAKDMLVIHNYKNAVKKGGY